jgi:FecR-like protein
VSGHIAPHRWADAWAGRVTDVERAAMDEHAASCTRCARARDRVTRASDSFVAIRSQSAPELSWDAVRAKVHWSVSTEKHARLRVPARPHMRWFAAGSVLAGAAAIGLLTGPIGAVKSAPIANAPTTNTDGSARPPLVAPIFAPPAPLVGLVNRATGDVLVDGLKPTDLFGRRLAAGDVITTGDGRVDVQFGEGSAFAIGTRSKLELRHFDAKLVELVVEGTVDITVAPRARDQRFLVIAGDRTVEVRGTQFRVRHDNAGTAVACHHGAVAVRDGQGQLEVTTARHVDVAAGHTVVTEKVAPMSADDVTALGDATPMTLPLWDPETLTNTSAPLEIATAGRHEVRVDGVELGQAPMRVRVLPGRHTVDVADNNGRFRRAGWVDVPAPSSGKAARLEVSAEPPATHNVSERHRQFLARLDRGRIAACARANAKQGLRGGMVTIEIGVDERGNRNYMNVLDDDVGGFARSCILTVLKDMQFPPGAKAEWHERIDL